MSSNQSLLLCLCFALLSVSLGAATTGPIDTPLQSRAQYARWSVANLAGTYVMHFNRAEEKIILSAKGRFTYTQTSSRGNTGSWSGAIRLKEGTLFLTSDTGTIGLVEAPTSLIPVHWNSAVYLVRPTQLFGFCAMVYEARKKGAPVYCLHRPDSGSKQVYEPDLPEPWLTLCRDGVPEGKILYKEQSGGVIIDLGKRHGLLAGARLSLGDELDPTEELVVYSIAGEVSRARLVRILNRRIEVGEPVRIASNQPREVYPSLHPPRPQIVTSSKHKEPYRVLEAVLSDLAKSENLVRVESDTVRKILLKSEGFEDFNPSDPHIEVGDPGLIFAEVERQASLAPREQAEMIRFELNQSYFGDAFHRLFPRCSAYILCRSIEIMPDGTAKVRFSMGPGAHGLGSGEYLLSRSGSRWVITKRSLFFPQ